VAYCHNTVYGYRHAASDNMVSYHAALENLEKETGRKDRCQPADKHLDAD